LTVGLRKAPLSLTHIAAGRLSPGAESPSVRQLARDLGVAPTTVVRAYAERKTDGWITMTLHRGAMVAERSLIHSGSATSLSSLPDQ
jgi:GntR family transcriptional regulator